MRSSYAKIFVFCICLVLTGSIKLCAQKMTAFDQLRSVNAGWNDQADIDPFLFSLPAKDLDEAGLIKFHLQETEKLLRKRCPGNLTALQKISRENNLNILRAYRLRGIFPINDMHLGRQPYFIDKFNTYCAAGYLMQQSGADKMARDINRLQNFNYLIDISHPDLMNWVNGSGLSLDELALIQPAYDTEPCYITELHYNNTGVDVNEYIEVRQASTPVWRFESIRFYDHTGLLYKTLLKSSMQSFFESGHQIYHYLFPSNESLADSGRIEFITGTSVLAAEFQYNASGITYTDHAPFVGGTKYFPDVEDANTPVGSSLTFCGRWRFPDGSSTWAASILPATIGILNPCTVMAIDVATFSSVIHNTSIELKWKKAAHANDDHFIVERSADGINFTSLGMVKAIPGLSNAMQDYNYFDNAPGYINQYRLKQVDVNQGYTNSAILYVKFTNANPVRIISNPVSTNLVVELNTTAAITGTLLIYDFHGRKMLEQTARQGRQDIDVSAFPAGKYLIQLQATKGMVYNQVFMKK
jgi:Secretion system C-terminal sorting domain